MNKSMKYINCENFRDNLRIYVKSYNAPIKNNVDKLYFKRFNQN